MGCLPDGRSDRRGRDNTFEAAGWEREASGYDDFFGQITGLLGGTVRTSALIVGQPDETRERIRAEFDRVVSQYRRSNGSRSWRIGLAHTEPTLRAYKEMRQHQARPALTPRGAYSPGGASSLSVSAWRPRTG